MSPELCWVVTGPSGRVEPEQAMRWAGSMLVVRWSEGVAMSTPRAVGSYGEIRARILSRLLCEHEKEVVTPHKGPLAFGGTTKPTPKCHLG